MSQIVPNVENLEVGKRYTYKELCLALGEEVKSNREKQYQRWRRFFEFEKQGRLYIVLKIFDKPIVDGRSNGNHSKYIDLFKDVIMYCLEGKEEITYETQNNWLLRCGVVNTNLFRDYKELAKEYSNLMPNHFGFYMKNCQADIKQFVLAKFRSAIRNLEKQGYICVRDTYNIVEADNSSRIAMPQEETQIEEVHKNIMQALGVKSFQDAYYKDTLPVLFNEINKELYKTYGFKKATNILGLAQTSQAFDYCYVSKNNQEAKEELNILITKGLEEHFINKARNNRKNFETKSNEMIDKWYLDEDISQINLPFRLEGDYDEVMLNIMWLFLSL